MAANLPAGLQCAHYGVNAHVRLTTAKLIYATSRRFSSGSDVLRWSSAVASVMVMPLGTFAVTHNNEAMM